MPWTSPAPTPTPHRKNFLNRAWNPYLQTFVLFDLSKISIMRKIHRIWLKKITFEVLGQRTHGTRFSQTVAAWRANVTKTSLLIITLSPLVFSFSLDTAATFWLSVVCTSSVSLFLLTHHDFLFCFLCDAVAIFFWFSALFAPASDSAAIFLFFAGLFEPPLDLSVLLWI